MEKELRMKNSATVYAEIKTCDLYGMSVEEVRLCISRNLSENDREIANVFNIIRDGWLEGHYQGSN